MLVLTRKQGERISIGEGITITVNQITGNRVVVAVTAPRQIRIVRSELLRRLPPSS